MNICVEEHHGYFTLDMSCYNGSGFCNSSLQGLRLSLIYIPSGHGTLSLNDREISYDAPALLCINESDRIHISNHTDIQAILFHPSVINTSLDFENIRSFSSDLNLTAQQDCFYFQPFLTRQTNFCGILFPAFDSKSKIENLFATFSTQTTLQDSNYWACRSRSCLIELLSLACNCLEHQLALLSTTEKSNNSDVLRVIAFLESNLHQKITISDLTRRFQMNRTDLSRLFVNYTGETIMQFVNRSRIELAATLLRDTTIPMSEVMERTGFTDYSYFSRTFRKQKGMSPRNYRKEYCWMLP